MKRGFLKRTKPESDEMTLQITSMADIFTIILVFLLKGYSTSALNITPSQGLMLPEAHAAESAVEALKIEVSKSAVQVEGQSVTSLADFKFDRSELNTNGSTKSLGSALERERKRQMLIAAKNTDVKVDAKVLIIADQHAPYSTIKAVLASAALNGYTDFKLVTSRSE